jgi:hypothetical protein
LLSRERSVRSGLAGCRRSTGRIVIGRKRDLVLRRGALGSDVNPLFYKLDSNWLQVSEALLAAGHTTELRCTATILTTTLLSMLKAANLRLRRPATFNDVLVVQAPLLQHGTPLCEANTSYSAAKN